MPKQMMKLTVGGPVQAKYGTYLPRPADEQLFAACQSGEFAYVLACRQIGKSSLMFETSDQLAKVGIKTAVIDLNSIGQSAEADDWYFSLLDELARKLGLIVDVQYWWETKPSRLTLTQRFLQFFGEVVLKQISDSIVIFIDEIDMTLGLEFNADDFFAAIRSVHNDRAQNPDYHRLTFVLLGVATPDELIKDHTRTPFNIGQAITLRDFTEPECDPFRLRIEARFPEYGRHYFQKVFEWTDGHPYLTQKLCEAVINGDIAAPNGNHTFAIDDLVKRLFLAAEARAEDNIQFVQTRITSDPFAQEMLKTYKRVLENEQPVQDDEQSPAINRLKLYGLVVTRNGKLAVRNKLYAQAFNKTWAEEMLRVSSTTIRLQLPDSYKILQEIGQGGFATVYLAQYQPGEQIQTVALKVLKGASLEDTNQVKRFKQEARTVAKLDHPNIIHILDTGGDEESFYITMEYVADGNLRDRIKQGGVPRNEAIHILKHIGAALTHAHDQGIIHRDIKPENILLDTSQELVRPVLTDFGLIKLLTVDDENYTQIQSSAIMGTFDYMAPEQWGQQPPTPATDLYGLAITCFEMLTGKRPFASTSPMELMNKHANEPLPLLSQIAPQLGTFFDDILSRAAAKKPSDRFENIADFVAAMEAANAEIETVEHAQQKEEAAGVITAARNYIKKDQYDADRALAMVEVALEIYPDYVDALRLRGKIRLEQAQFEIALADYQRAYSQNSQSSEIGLEYLDVLSQAADNLWQQGHYQEAVQHYQTIRQVLQAHGQVKPMQELWQKARLRLVKYHYDEGRTAYAGGVPESQKQALEQLAQNIQALETLEAVEERNDLQEKARLLNIAKYQARVETTLSRIKNIDEKESHIRFNEDIFQDFQALDEAYQALISADPDNEQWKTDRRKYLQERAQRRAIFAVRALGKLDPDYESALRHYKAIQDLDPEIAAELDLNLAEKIAELQVKADHDGKYNEIRALMDKGEIGKALERLEREFVQEGNVEHRDVARLLWGLVYAKQHEGNLPPEWESVNVFHSLSKRLIGGERQQIQYLKNKLEPWSQNKILETINRETSTLKQAEEDIKGIEAMFREAIARGVAQTPDVEQCWAELSEAHGVIHQQREVFYGIDVDRTTQKVEAWLQKIEDIEDLLNTGNPIKDIPEFLDRIDREQQTIEKDDIFETLQDSIAASHRIKWTISDVKLRIKERLAQILITEIGQKDDEINRARQQVAEAKGLLTEAQAETVKAQHQVAETERLLTSEKQKIARIVQRTAIAKWLIPLVVISALLAGGLIANQTLAQSSPVRWVAGGLLAASLGYYFWTYYLFASDD